MKVYKSRSVAHVVAEAGHLPEAKLGPGLIYLALDAGFKVTCLKPVPNLAIRDVDFIKCNGIDMRRILFSRIHRLAGPVFPHKDTAYGIAMNTVRFLRVPFEGEARCGQNLPRSCEVGDVHIIRTGKLS